MALLPDLGLRRIVKPKGNEKFGVFLDEDVVARVDLASHCHVWNLVEVARDRVRARGGYVAAPVTRKPS